MGTPTKDVDRGARSEAGATSLNTAAASRKGKAHARPGRSAQRDTTSPCGELAPALVTPSVVARFVAPVANTRVEHGLVVELTLRTLELKLINSRVFNPDGAEMLLPR